MAERADHDRRRSGSFSKPHARLRAPEEEYVCSRRRRSRADRKLARGPGDLRERHGDLVTRRIPAAAPGVAESSTRYFRQSDSGDDLFGRAASRASGRVARRGEHRGEMQLSANAGDRASSRTRRRRSSAPLERDRCVAAAEQRVRSLRRSVAGWFDAPDRAAVAARWRPRVTFPRIRSAAAARCIRCARRRRRSSSGNRNGAASLRAAAGRHALQRHG